MTARYKQQQGLALITVLMIFAIVSILAVSMIERQAADVQRSGTMLSMQQAKAFVIGAEQAVRTGLFMDWSFDKEKDHALEEWAQDRSFPLNPGTAFISIRDAQGRFNLNSLAKTSANRDRQLQRFTHLLNILGLDPEIAGLVSRWMDSESQDEDRYLSLQPAYRPAHQACKHTSELMLIERIDAEAYGRLEPFVACLPQTAMLNVNSASPAVLASLDKSLSLADGENMANARGEKGFSSLDDFWGLPEVKPFTGPGTSNNNDKPRWEQGDFSVKSEYFEAFIRVDLMERIATSEVLIKRDAGTGQMTTLYRDFSRREARPEAVVNTNNPTTITPGS